MKRNLLLLTFFLGLSSILIAQELRVNGYSSYVFSNRFDSYYDPFNYYQGRVSDAYRWGAGIEFVNGYKGIELSYLRNEAEADIEYYDNGIVRDRFDVAMNYIMLGGRNYFKTGSLVEPYGGVQVGAAIIELRNQESGRGRQATKLAWGIRLGTNIWMNDNVGLNLQADLMSVVQGIGGSFYFGSGGSGVGVSAQSSIYQFGVGGGLTFRLPTK